MRLTLFALCPLAANTQPDKSRKGKKRMRHRTPFSSPTPTTAAAGDAVDTANASPPGQEQSKLTAVSFSSPQLLPRSAVESGVSPASSSSSAWQTTLRDGRRATMRLSPRSNRQRSPRLLADTPPPVATSDAPSPLPPLEVLDLSLASPMATEVIDIDTEDSPAPLPPPLRRGLLAHDSLPTTITDTNSSTLRRWTGESGEGYRESVDGMVGAAIGGGRGKAGTATSSGDGAGDADVATAENLRRLPVGLDISSAVGTSHSARRMSVSPTVGPPIAALGGRSSSSSRSSMDTNILRATEGNPADREDERRTVGVSSHRKRRQSQQQTRGLGGRSLSRSTEVKDGENSMSPAVARWTRRRAMLSDNDKMMAARLHQRESLLQEQSDLEMAQRLQSQEAAEQAEYARAVAEVMQVAVHAGGGVGGIGDSGVGAAWPGVLDPGLDFDNHPWEGMDSDSFRDELGSVTLETTDDEANSDDGVFMGERINHRGGTSSGNAANGGGAAARAASAAVAISLPRDRRNVRSRSTRDEANDAPPRTRGASAAVVDVAAAASDHDDVIPLAAGGSGSTSRSAAEGVRVASSRAVRVGGSPRPPPAPNTASGSSFVSTSISSSSSQAAAGAPQRARPGLSRASTHASAGRGGPGSAAGGRGAYSHLRAAASAATATRRPAGASASARSGALPHAPSSGRAGEVRVLSSAAEARRRRQESNGTSRRRMSIAERYRGELHIAHLMSQIMPSMVLHRGFGIGGDGRGSERGGGGGGRGRGGAERGVAGTAAHFALMTRSLTSADYQQLLALGERLTIVPVYCACLLSSKNRSCRTESGFHRAYFIKQTKCCYLLTYTCLKLRWTRETRAYMLALGLVLVTFPEWHSSGSLGM